MYARVYTSMSTENRFLPINSIDFRCDKQIEFTQRKEHGLHVVLVFKTVTLINIFTFSFSIENI